MDSVPTQICASLSDVVGFYTDKHSDGFKFGHNHNLGTSLSAKVRVSENCHKCVFKKEWTDWLSGLSRTLISGACAFISSHSLKGYIPFKGQCLSSGVLVYNSSGGNTPTAAGHNSNISADLPHRYVVL